MVLFKVTFNCKINLAAVFYGCAYFYPMIEFRKRAHAHSTHRAIYSRCECTCVWIQAWNHSFLALLCFLVHHALLGEHMLSRAMVHLFTLGSQAQKHGRLTALFGGLGQREKPSVQTSGARLGLHRESASLLEIPSQGSSWSHCDWPTPIFKVIDDIAFVESVSANNY